MIILAVLPYFRPPVRHGCYVLFGIEPRCRTMDKGRLCTIVVMSMFGFSSSSMRPLMCGSETNIIIDMTPSLLVYEAYIIEIFSRQVSPVHLQLVSLLSGLVFVFVFVSQACMSHLFGEGARFCLGRVRLYMLQSFDTEVPRARGIRELPLGRSL